MLDAVAIDWEDIAAGPCPEDGATTHCLYIADTGNNNRARDVLTIFIVAEPSISGADPARPLSVKARAFRFRYPDRPEDTEALAVLPNGDVTIVTKGRTPSISFFGFAKADIAKALMSHEVLTATSQGDTRHRARPGTRPMGDGGGDVARRHDARGQNLQRDLFLRARERRRRATAGAICSDRVSSARSSRRARRWTILDEKTLILGSETSQGRQGVLHRVQCGQ